MEALTTPTTKTSAIPALEVSDIQATVLRPRPSPYKGEYLIVRIGDAMQGREMLRRLIPHVAPADNWWAPTLPGWLAIALTFHGLKALGVPQASLDSFPQEFSELPGGRNPFGFKDGLHNPHVEGGGEDVHPGYGPAIKSGEFVMGYPDELGETATTPEPEALRRNGTFVAFRKFHTRVAAFRKYLREQASSPEEEELIAAKMVGRWRSGAPLVLAPTSDDPSLGADLDLNNAFNYEDDMKGLKCPFSAHIRRVNPRDALRNEIVAVNLHQFLRRGTNYGQPLQEGELEDDGAERGGVFLLIGAHLKQQFEFVQSQWVTNGDFINQGTEQDPIIGNNQVDRTFTIPKLAIRRRLHGLPQFVDVRGGEYCFMPGIRALKWLASLATENTVTK